MGQKVLPCPDPDCDKGHIIIRDAYSPAPLVGKKVPCDKCNGFGFLVFSSSSKEVH